MRLDTKAKDFNWPALARARARAEQIAQLLRYCDHCWCEYREKVVDGEVVSRGYQCRLCGQENPHALSDPLEEAEWIAAGDLVPWDWDHERDTKTLLIATGNMLLDSQIAHHRDYLNSDVWQTKRLRILKRDGFKCARCNASNTTLDVHHETYARIFDEPDTDLVTLCRNCHDDEHGITYTAT